jgi:hypothetical protein
MAYHRELEQQRDLAQPAERVGPSREICPLAERVCRLLMERARPGKRAGKEERAGSFNKELGQLAERESWPSRGSWQFAKRIYCRCRLGIESCQLRITLIPIGVTMYGSNFFNVKYLEK